MKGGRLLALVVVLAWFYVLLAALANPVYTPPVIPGNPIMPFLTADAVDRLWPIVLVSSPLVVIAGQQLIRSPGGTRREVSPQEFARIQARAHATRERIKEDISRSEPRRSKPTQRETATAESVEPASPSTNAERRGIAAEELLSSTATTSESEFTPPPTTPRGSQARGTEPAAGVSKETVEESGTKLSEMKLQEEKEASMSRRIDELEAERAAMASLMDRLEDMRKLGAVQPELYDRLKKKYIGELEKINAKVERLPVNEELKKKAAKK